MNLEKLFQTQKVLRDRIGYNEPDRFNKLILALLVELGECANEWRGFKFWSQNQSPRTHKARGPYMDLEDAEFYNPLLEEYVDGLHFVLELGIETGYENIKKDKAFVLGRNITKQFNEILLQTANVLYSFQSRSSNHETFHYYESLVHLFIGLGEMLGFTWEEVEQAYFTKNEINHTRQESGY
jgi:dimeric dUTPase (all-alpha-NTP-PPase superfamily)